MGTPEKIRLLIVTHTLHAGGLEEVVATYGRLLNKDRFQVTLAYIVGGSVSEELRGVPGLKLVHVNAAGRMNRFRVLLKLALQERPHIVHNHFSWYGLMVGVLAGARRVETVHNVYGWFNGFQRVLYTLQCMLANMIIAVSDGVRLYTIKSFPFIPPSKIVVVRNGIDPDHFRRSASREDARRSLGVDPYAVVIGYVGRLEKEKGLSWLLEAAVQLNGQHRNLRFLIVGDGSAKGRLEEEAKTLGLSNVEFAGHVPDVRPLLGTFDIFVLPSLYEGIPLGLLQAMAFECPVVATRVGGVPEVVVDGGTGYLIEPRDVQGLVDRLKTLSMDRSLRDTMGQAGRDRVVREFSARGMVEQTEQLYRRLRET